jgi:hypothetical protein
MHQMRELSGIGKWLAKKRPLLAKEECLIGRGSSWPTIFGKIAGHGDFTREEECQAK